MNEYVDLSLRQFVQAWKQMCSSCPRPRSASLDGIEFVFSSLPIGFFNLALPTETGLSGAALASCARSACAWASEQAVPWLFVVTHEALAPGVDATAVLESCGLAPMMPLTGMLAQRVSPATRVPDGLRLEVASSDRSCAAVLDVNSAAYGMDLAAAKESLGRMSFWKDHFAVVGSTGGKPACSAAVLMVDGHRYVALVATEPGHQRRGYAEAAMRRALEASAELHGELPTFLHATAAGRPIYERMGYVPVASHTVFVEKRFLEGH